MELAKAIDKIKKCLALSKSANEHEAAAAMRQAQALMAKHGIDEGTLGLGDYGVENVDCPIQAGVKIPMVLTILVNVIKDAFGVKPIVSKTRRVSDLSWTIRYFGPKHRIQTAAYAHQVVYRAMESAWKIHLTANPYLRGIRDARTSFQCGWLNSVANKIEDIGFTDEERQMTDIVIKTDIGTLVDMKMNEGKIYGGLVNAGAEAGNAFSIHRPMDKETLAIRKL